jgi:hypothetical protein
MAAWLTQGPAFSGRACPPRASGRLSPVWGFGRSRSAHGVSGSCLHPALSLFSVISLSISFSLSGLLSVPLSLGGLWLTLSARGFRPSPSGLAAASGWHVSSPCPRRWPLPAPAPQAHSVSPRGRWRSLQGVLPAPPACNRGARHAFPPPLVAVAASSAAPLSDSRQGGSFPLPAGFATLQPVAAGLPSWSVSWPGRLPQDRRRIKVAASHLAGQRNPALGALKGAGFPAPDTRRRTGSPSPQALLSPSPCPQSPSSHPLPVLPSPVPVTA